MFNVDLSLQLLLVGQNRIWVDTNVMFNALLPMLHNKVNVDLCIRDDHNYFVLVKTVVLVYFASGYRQW